LRALKEVAGVDDERVLNRRKLEKQLQQGTLPIPFAWRPRHVLDAVPDVLTLWEMGKRSSWTDRQLHLSMSIGESKVINSDQLRGQTPLLDLTALLVINDLELFAVLFEVFPRIAVGKATLLVLQQMLSPMSGSPYREKCRSLQDQLKRRFRNIDQPGLDEPAEDSLRKARWASEEIKEIIKSGQYMLYADDVFFSIYAGPPTGNPPSICTLDLLAAAELGSFLSTRQAAEKVAKLCSWRVGLNVLSRYQYAILPLGLDRTSTIGVAIDHMRNDELCNALYSAIWDIGKDYQTILHHGGSIIGELVGNPENSIHTVTALAGFWLSKVRFHDKAPSPPLRLLATLIVQVAALGDLNMQAAGRLWNLYRTLTEYEFGDRMDDTHYARSIDVLAAESVSADIAMNSAGRQNVYSLLCLGLTGGTSDYERYTGQYSSVYILKTE
jgi:hypothetical protein